MEQTFGTISFYYDTGRDNTEKKRLSFFFVLPIVFISVDTLGCGAVQGNHRMVVDITFVFDGGQYVAVASSSR